MSDTITAPAEESIYPSFSEASENDVRETSEDIAETPELEADPDGAGDKPPVNVVEAAEQPEEPEETEDDLRARNARLARTLREEKRRARQLEVEAQVLRGQRTEQPDEAMQREIALRAHQMAQNQVINDKANAVFAEGVKAYGRFEFEESVKAVNETFGATLMPYVIDTLIDVEHSEKVIHYLADNPDIADQMALLPPHKLAAALAREASKINSPKPRPVSKAPPPIRPIATVSAPEVADLDKMSMDELAKMWDRRDNERRMRS